jgi:hypothetical protein
LMMWKLVELLAVVGALDRAELHAVSGCWISRDKWEGCLESS